MKKNFGIILLFFLFLLGGCTGAEKETIKNKPETNKQSNEETESYKGADLKILVFGEVPRIKEGGTVTFIHHNLSDIQDVNFSDYDAIFIMKDQIENAVNNKDAKLLKNSPVPIFFFEPDKWIQGYFLGTSTYAEFPKIEDKSYAIGYLTVDNEYRFWSYSLYNDIKNEENIQNVYTRVFFTIEELNKKQR